MTTHLPTIRSAVLASALLMAAAILAAEGAGTPLRAQAASGAADGGGEVAPAIVIHGGAGSIREVDMTAEEEAEHRSKMGEALRAGHGVLQEGGTAVDACVAAIQVMERSPLYNSGVGAVFTSEGTVEHDASIMRGSTRNSGAVAGTRHLWSPIAAARLVMDSSRHVMLAQEGAEAFARQHGMEMVPNDTFYTEERLARWRERQREEGDGASGPRASSEPAADRAPADGHLGTVGCAARDRRGNLAAGTSTGGTSNKRWGRIGDSPVIGAGTYADNETVAVSATGYGEFFIRGVVAHDIASMMRYAGLDLAPAVNAVIHGRLEELGPQATGGVIALDRHGKIAVAFNTPGMFRGWIGTDGEMAVEFYRD